MLDALAPARRRLVLLALLAALLAALVAVSLVVVHATERLTPVAQDEPGPVLLVSGYGGSVGSLEPLRSALVEAGRDVVVVPPLGAGTGDLDAQARSLARRADAAMDRFAATSVDVVGYSAGGVVARAWVRHHGGGSVARRVLSIGSPQHGTTLADVAVGLVGRCPPACRQLQPSSELLRDLNARDETPRGPAFVSVWSTSDEVVVPTASARLAGALDVTVQSVCPHDRAQHGDLPSDPVVQGLLVSALGRRAPARPADVAC